MLVGLLLAFGTAITTGLASVVQAVAARRNAEVDVRRLVVSPLYLAGTGLDALGFFCLIGALHWLPLFLVQCASASSVGVTAVVGRRVLGSWLRGRDLFTLLGLAGGLVLLAAGAQPEAASGMRHADQWWLLIAVGPVAVVGAVLERRDDALAGGLLSAVAGLAFAGTGITSRVLSDAHSVGDVVTAPATYALAAFGAAGMVFFAAALQRTPVTRATATLFGVETLAASAVGLLVLGDATRPGFGVSTAIGFTITLGCAIALALSAGAEGSTSLREVRQGAVADP